MEVKVKTYTTYDITIGGVTRAGWVVTSQWNGLVKLEREGEVIIGALKKDSAFDWMMMLLTGPEDREETITLIYASLSLHTWLKGENDESSGSRVCSSEKLGGADQEG